MLNNTQRTDSSGLQPSTPGGSPPSTSPSSLAPPDGSPASVLSRPVSPSIRESHRFTPVPSTKEIPETPCPKSLRDHECPRTGFVVSTAEDWLSRSLPVGVRIYVHSTKTTAPVPQGEAGGEETDPEKAFGPMAAILTSGPTLHIGDKPCMLTAAPIPEKTWRHSSQAIAYQFDKQMKNNPDSSNSPKSSSSKAAKEPPKMQDTKGRYLTSLRNYGMRSRASSVASAFKSFIPTPTLMVPSKPRGAKKAGRVWLCNLGCEGATGRKRDWSLVELDPNVAGPPADRRNVVLIGGKEVTLLPPTKKGAKPGTRVVLATLASRNIALGGVTGEKEENVFGYSSVQKINLDKGTELHDGDAGACVLDEATGQCYGILVMLGMLKKDVEEERKKKEKKDDPVRTQSVAWFVPLDKIIEDICVTYPLDHITFGP